MFIVRLVVNMIISEIMSSGTLNNIAHSRLQCAVCFLFCLDDLGGISVLAGASCADGELSMNSKCYRKFDSQVTWFNASNDCLMRAESLAVFTDVGLNSKSNRRTTADNNLTAWLNTDTDGAHKTYWIGLVRSWWKTDGGKGTFWHANQLGKTHVRSI